MDLAANEKAVHSDFFNGEKILLFLIEIKMWSSVDVGGRTYLQPTPPTILKFI